MLVTYGEVRIVVGRTGVGWTKLTDRHRKISQSFAKSNMAQDNITYSLVGS